MAMSQKDILIKREIANLAKLFKAKLPARDYDVHTTFSMKASDRYNKVRQLVQASDVFSRKVTNTFKITGDIDLSRKQNIVFKFKTDSSREDLLQQIISALESRDKKIEIPHKYSSIGGVILNVSDTTPIPFHFLVKYKDPNAFRYLKYTNPLLDSRNWHQKHSYSTTDT